MTTRLHSIEYGSNASVVAKMLRVLFPDAVTALDMTYGSGKFWTGHDAVCVVGIDLSPERARHVCADYTRLPFPDGAFDVAIFDPPYLTEPSKHGTSRMAARFSSFASVQELYESVTRGAAEAWRVSRLGVIVKVQNYAHSDRVVRMTSWIERVIPEGAYGEVHRANAAKMIPATWKHQRSVYATHTTFLAFRHGSQDHSRLRRYVPVPVEQPQQGELFEREVAG